MQFSKNVKITIGIMCLTGVCALSSLVGCSGNHGTNKKTETTNKVANETTGEVLNAGMMNLEDDIFGNESYEQDTYLSLIHIFIFCCYLFECYIVETRFVKGAFCEKTRIINQTQVFIKRV